MHVLYSAVFQFLRSILSPLLQFVGIFLRTVLRDSLLLTIAFGVAFAVNLSILVTPAQADSLTTSTLVTPFLVTERSPLSSPRPLAAIPLVSQWFAGSAPTNLGVQDDRLAPCPASPNCILSQETDPAHRIAPLTYQGDRSRAYENLLKILSVVPRTRIVSQTDNYIRVEFTSRLMGFVDDGEFYFPTEDGIIQVRSASRLGESDLGVNRTRMEQIRLALQDLTAFQA